MSQQSNDPKEANAPENPNAPVPESGEQGQATFHTGSTTQGGSNYGQGSHHLGGGAYRQGDASNSGANYDNETDRIGASDIGTNTEGMAPNPATNANAQDQNTEGQSGQ